MDQLDSHSCSWNNSTIKKSRCQGIVLTLTESLANLLDFANSLLPSLTRNDKYQSFTFA